MINIDGLPLFKSANISLWPILVQFGCFQPIAVAFFCGRTKPPFDLLLKGFVAELSVLVQQGIRIGDHLYSVSITCFTSDAPARAYIKGIIHHTGYYSCERCTKKGTIVNRRRFFDKPQDSGSQNDVVFRRNEYAGKDGDGRSHQTEQSALLPLPTNFITDFALD